MPEQLLRHDEADAAERIIGGSGGRSASRSGTKPRTRLLSNPLFAPPQAQ